MTLCLVGYAVARGRGAGASSGVLPLFAIGLKAWFREEVQAARSIARPQSATPKIDRIARQWLPRREMLAARLARTGRRISVGQYVIASLAVAVSRNSGRLLAPIGIVPSLLSAS